MVSNSKRLNWLFAATLALGAAACGDDDGAVGDDGAVIRIDGGGTPDSARLCGNGQMDPGEQCDDGNTSNNDLCSNLCRNIIPVPASCAASQIVNLNTLGVQDGLVTSFTGSLDMGASDIEPPAMCALAGGSVTPGAANNRVHKFTLGIKADLLITTQNDGTPDLDSVVYVTSTCQMGVVTGALGCNDDADTAQSEVFLSAVAPGDYFITVYAYNADAAMTPDYQLDVIVRPVLALSATCDAGGILNRCDANLACKVATPGARTGTCMTGAAPVITSVTFSDLGMNNTAVTIKGTDADGDVVGYELELLNAAGTPITLAGGVTTIQRGFDQDLTAQTTFVGSEALGLGTTLGPMVMSVRVKATDSAGLKSAPTTAAKAVPPMVAVGLACDATGRENVCATGLSCQGTPATTCVTPSAPVVQSATGFTVAGGGRRVIVNATDADGDINRIILTWFAGTTPVMIDADGAAGVEASSVLGASQIIGTTTNVLKRDLAATLFAAAPGSTIDRVEVTVRDAGMRVSNMVSITFAALPTPAAAAACDPRRFSDECVTGLVCNGDATGVCEDLTASKTAACTAPTVLTLDTPVNGTISIGPDRWSPSCDNPASGGSEKVYSITTAALGDLRVTTDFAQTDIDSLVYVTSNCGATLTELGCTDDISQENLKTDGFIQNVPAGTAFVIVDSYNVLPNRTAGAGNFRLNVSLRTIAASGAACDPLNETSRCTTGLRCKPNATYSMFTCGN